MFVLHGKVSIDNTIPVLCCFLLSRINHLPNLHRSWARILFRVVASVSQESFSEVLPPGLIESEIDGEG